MRVLVVLGPMLLIGCTHQQMLVDVSDLLVACKPLEQTADAVSASCNEDFTVAVAESSSWFPDNAALLDGFVSTMKDWKQTPATVAVDGEELPAVLLEALPEEEGETGSHGSVVVRHGRVSSCVAWDDVPGAEAACLRIHAALLAGGRALVKERLDAAALLPAVPLPVGGRGCSLDHEDGAPDDDFHLDCGDRVLDVSNGGPDLRGALEQAITDEIEGAKEDGAQSIVLERGTCEVLGQRGPCATVVADGWWAFLGTAQTRDGRRLIACGADQHVPGEGCPIHVVGPAGERIVVRRPATF
jgi:hypothetical protein